MIDCHDKPEQNPSEIGKQKEAADKCLLFTEVFVGVLLTTVALALVTVASLVQMEEWLRILLIVIGFVPFLVACPLLLKIEQMAGYYECAKCGHKHVPTYSSVLWAMHRGRTRRLQCPKCGKKSWQKKVLK